MISLSRRTFLASGAATLSGLSPTRAQNTAKIDLWDNATGPHLRGAVIAQRRVYPQIDGPEFLGPGPVGSPVSDRALSSLTRAGANLVILSLPGTFSEAPPYNLDPVIEAHLDDMVRRCARAGLFVVIGFRTGPGRSSFTFHRDSAGTWFPEHMINDSLWTSYEAQSGWERMWRRTARRFRDNPNIVGYCLMIEPNANQVGLGPDGIALNEWNPERLARRVSGTPADWPALARRLAAAVREQDRQTPILMSPDSYAHTRFSSLLDLNCENGIVLAVHDYSPRDYTHQSADNPISFEPGSGEFTPPDAEHWMMGELGVVRWAPQADRYIMERTNSLERAGAGWAFFRWDTGWRVHENQENRFNPVYGGNPEGRSPFPTNPLMGTLEAQWSRNWQKPQLYLRP